MGTGTKNVGEVSACANEGECADKDDCHCVQTPSILWTVYPHFTKRGMTGWAGTDCSMPICNQVNAFSFYSIKRAYFACVILCL